MRYLVLIWVLVLGGVAFGQKPNVVVILADDLGWGDVGCYGGDVETPSIDGLAAEGVRFTNFYVTSPVCTPSRFSIFTGLMPQRAKGGLKKVIMVLNAKHDGYGLHESERTVAEALQGEGYRTALIGKWHLGGGSERVLPNQQGFDYFYGARGGCIDYFTHHYGILPDWYRNGEAVVEEGYATDLLTKDAVRWIGEQKKGKPFFLVLSHFAPHFGKTIIDDEDRVKAVAKGDEGTLVMKEFGTYPDLEDGTPRRLGNTLQVDKVTSQMKDADGKPIPREYFKQMVRSMDQGIGEVLRALDSSGLAENTVVVFLSDHGSDQTESSAGNNNPFRGSKHNLFEGGVRIPMIVRWPGKIDANSTVSSVGSTLDLFPTLLQIAGSKSIPKLDGLPQLDVWLGKKRGVQDRVLLWQLGKTRAIRQGKWKMVGKQLFDLEANPAESKNLAKQKPEVVKRLQAMLKKSAASF